MEQTVAQQIIDKSKEEDLRIRIDSVQVTPTFKRVFVLVAAGMFLDAIDVYLASGVSSYLLKEKWSTLALNSTFLSVGFLGLFLGSITAGLVGDFFGRKKAYQLNLIIFGSFTLLGAFAPNMPFLIGCRLIASIGLGTEIVTGFAMINEFAPVKQRGRWCALTSFVANCGAPIALLLCTILIPIFTWRIMFIISGSLAIILCYFRRSLPESPRWNIIHGNYEEAEKTITEIENEMKEKKITVDNNVKEKIDYTQANEMDRHFVKNLIVAMVAVTATIVCQYTFTSWVPTLLVKEGINVVSSLGFSTVMMLGAPVGAFIGSMIVDRVGRKPTIVSAFICATILGIMYGHQTTAAGVMINGFLLTTCFYILMASVVAVYTSELFSTKYRFRGAGIANGISKLVTVGMPYAVAWMLTVTDSSMIFTTIGVFAFVAGAVVFFFGPETNNKII